MSYFLVAFSNRAEGRYCLVEILFEISAPCSFELSFNLPTYAQCVGSKPGSSKEPKE
jgi:hypothetical protein